MRRRSILWSRCVMNEAVTWLHTTAASCTATTTWTAAATCSSPGWSGIWTGSISPSPSSSTTSNRPNVSRSTTHLALTDYHLHIAILVSACDHCLADLLYRHSTGELLGDIVMISAIMPPPPWTKGPSSSKMSCGSPSATVLRKWCAKGVTWRRSCSRAPLRWHLENRYPGVSEQDSRVR